MLPNTSTWLVLTLLAACAAPGVDIVPQTSDFAVVEITLEG